MTDNGVDDLVEPARIEVLFFERKDDKVCFHVEGVHIAILTHEEAEMLMNAMKREGGWHSGRIGNGTGVMPPEVKV